MFSCYRDFTTIIFYCVLHSETLLYIYKKNPLSINCLSAVESDIPMKIRALKCDFEPPVLVNIQSSFAAVITDILV